MIQSGGVLLKTPDRVVWSGTTATLGLGASPWWWSSYSSMYRQQLWVSVVVNKRGRGTARLPMKVYERAGNDDRTDARNSPYGQLLRKPNPRLDSFGLWLWTSSTFDIYGEAIWLKVRDPGGRPIALYPMHPTCATCELKNGRVVYDFYTSTVSLEDVDESNVVHFRTYNPDDPLRGLSQLEPLRSTLENEDAARRATSSFWRRGARPGTALVHPGNLSKPAADRLKVQYDSIAAGADNTGATVVFEEGMTPQKLDLTAEEAQYIETRKLNREEVCGAYDVPPPVVHILDRATFCLPADALVMTDRGSTPIADVKPTDRVWSLVDGSLRSRRVLWSGQTGFKPLLTIKTQNRTLRCTDNHPVLVRRTKRTVRVGSPGAAYTHSLDWVPAGELAVGDILVTANELPDHGGDECPTRTVSEGFAEFCGLLMGDGNVMARNTGVSIARASTALYMDHYRQVMRDEFTQQNGAVVLQEAERQTRFSSVSAARELAALGLAGTAHTKGVPSWVFQLSPKLRAAFLRGFLDSDGSVDKKGRISFSSCNPRMLRQVRELCIGIGVPVTNLSHRVGETFMPNGRVTPVDQWSFTCSDPGRNRLIGSHDPRYIERLESGKPFGTYYEYPVAGRSPLPAPAGCGYARVVSIKSTPESVPVYDLEVDGAHNFIAEGVVVHNSNITEQMRSMYRDTMAPHLKGFESTLETQLRDSTRPGASEPDFGDEFYGEFLLDEVLRGDFEVRSDAYQKGINSAQLTPNEARKLENRPALPGGDVLYINSTMVPIEQAGQRGTVIPATTMRTVMGRLSRPSSLDEVNPDALVDGLNGAGDAVRSAYWAAKAANEDVAGLRARLKEMSDA